MWRVIASVVFVVSLAGPLAAVTPAATAVLMSLHAIVAGILIWGLPRHTGTRRDPAVPSRPALPS